MARTAFEAWLEENGGTKSETSPVVFMQRGEITGGMRDFRPQPVHDEPGTVAALPHSTTATPSGEDEEGKDPGEVKTSSATESVPTSPGSILGGDLAGATAGKGASGSAPVTKAKLS